MKNTLSEELNPPRDQQTFTEIDRLTSEIQISLEKSRAGMERARRTDQAVDHQLQHLENQLKCLSG